MKDFISVIKNISTEEFIRFWGEVSIQIFKKDFRINDENVIRGTLRFPLKTRQGKAVPVMITGWDIPDMTYTSICYSNDYRSEHMSYDNAAYITNLYRQFENDRAGSEYLKDAEIQDAFKYLMGMTYEQFKFYNLAWALQNFSRNYHIMVASNKIDRSKIIKVEQIVWEQFQMELDELLANQLIIIWLCSHHPDPLNAPEEMYNGKVSGIVTKQRMEKIIDYYSASYQQIRDEKIGKQFFYSKPFVRTQKGKEQLMISIHLLIMVFADSLYWLERDYYKKHNMGLAFINEFGLMFEEYFNELLEMYLSKDMWSKIAENSRKSADYYIEFDDAIFLIELKSGIMGITAKQQTPDISQIDNFYSRNILEAYDQLVESEMVFRQQNKPIIKMILLYEFANNTQIMMASMPEIFEKDNNCYILTIADLEMFLATYKMDQNKFRKVIHELLTRESKRYENESFLDILNYHSAIGNLHFIEERDYLRHVLNKLKI